ncbi:ubiquitin C-terminal hydrolase 37 [Aspergillus mulundensis]|uniref:Ubiquitin carboxyl-terminal hydrolase n=1 Tax=Aspergillus mulundensis TaxID=1810919 RepID=A0A3D8SLP3_9EURO|nr:Ubiquitin carboxyl-terminal hydrolase [Aspergillus mulundensis]RDW87196.1 Ubiquitin carboxyl-terminal hydrolase [Aspergillus mulundensis]
MSERVKRRKVNNPTNSINGRINSQRATFEGEKESWNGFCELESEPAIFNVMLREFGVTGVQVQEVLSLEEKYLDTLNKPVYGIIFLFRWREDDPEKQEASCPEGLWFANQTASNACATVALLNIVNNIEGADLGENLRSFKDFTMPFTPALRGDAINNFEFVKRIHNSFARRMDILNSDLQLKHEVASKRKRSKKSGREEHEADAGFHFIAFVPALGKVWRFDGLERQPQALGVFEPESNWLSLVKPSIKARMAEYDEGQIAFSVLSFGRDPLPNLVEQLAMNIKQLQLAERTITSREPKESGSGPQIMPFLAENTLLGLDGSYGVTERVLNGAVIAPGKAEEYLSYSTDELAKHCADMSSAQEKLRIEIRDKQQLHRADDEYAEGRRYDYGPAIRTWLRLLARKRIVEDLIPISQWST